MSYHKAANCLFINFSEACKVTDVTFYIKVQTLQIGNRLVKSCIYEYILILIYRRMCKSPLACVNKFPLACVNAGNYQLMYYFTVYVCDILC